MLNQVLKKYAAECWRHFATVPLSLEIVHASLGHRVSDIGLGLGLMDSSIDSDPSLGGSGEQFC